MQELFYSPLPVELISFTGENKGAYNALRWITSTEINNAFFGVERRFETENEFTEIGKVAGQGFSTETHHYNFNDADIERDGMYYYRLRQVDHSGDEKLTHVVAILVEGGKVLDFDVYPNPTDYEATLEITIPSNMDIEVVIFDASGKLVLGKVVDELFTPGIATRTVDLRNLDAGVYHVQLRSDESIITRKLTIVR